MNWLLGLLEKLNRDDTVKELHHVATHTLPGLGAKLNASITNAQLMTQEGEQLPKELITLAEKMSGKSELFATTRDRLNKEVSELNLSVCTQIKQAIEEFFESLPITHFLDDAADNHNKKFKKLERELTSKDLSNALQEATAPPYPRGYPASALAPTARAPSAACLRSQAAAPAACAASAARATPAVSPAAPAARAASAA